MDIEESTSVVAQVGPEVFLDAMQATPDFDILIGGRAYDPAPYVAYAQFALNRQHPGLAEQKSEHRLGGFTHMGKVMECGGACSQPKSHGAIASVFADGVFDVRPLAFESRCTAQTVAAHALYENTRTDFLKGPGGALELLGAVYEELPDQRTVRVRGSIFKSSREQGLPYCFKLEAGKLVGYRSLFMGSIKDYGLIEQIDTLLPAVKAYVKQQHVHLSDNWNLDFHVYGRDHTNKRGGPGELFVVAEALAPSRELASSIASKARIGLIHAPYPKQKATSGNVGFGIGGLMEIEAGPCAEFSVYHLLELKLGEEHLVLDNTPEIEGSLQLRRTVQTFGHGRPTINGLDFQRDVARLRDTLRQPTTNSQPRATGEEAPRTCLPANLSDLCGVFRSKNAGPFEITIDAMFLTPQIYEAVKKSNILTPETVARELGVCRKDIIWMGFYGPAKAFKVTIPRIRSGMKKAAGGFMENDVHGSQEHVGLATLKLPQDLEDLVSLDSAASKAVVNTTREWTTVLGVAAAVGSLGVAALLKRLVSGR
ncbi:uncharacterized protein J7T54_004716 [Emericellopsis cladophorae]|uniref:Uncharacterized protein n=1 Tax=Emericellopsis cladophorae TaxID=2686198 RepID=A0A9P9Y6X4_9HYPO|nr:uncharacterized protein J7T54_004716 [Emericellopsis cladophorae]KAI6784170.1 hypothetical protein J7T54_004716 [Emericellopsis cladophorae]